MPLPRIESDQAGLLVVDMQEKLMPVIDGHERVVEQAAKLIRGCELLDVPVLATEQYPEALGTTVEPIREALPESAPVESKLKFSACVDPVRDQLRNWARPTILLCGIESHVCVTQTTLELLQAGYLVGVVTDAIGSRRPTDHDAALRRMQQAGAIPLSVEMALLEMLKEAGTDRFKQTLKLIK